MLRLARLIAQPSGSRSFSSTPVVFGKWHKVKGIKAASDSKKALTYSRAIRDIEVAIRHGGSADPSINATLAVSLVKARVAGLPKDNIEAAISRAANAKDNQSGQEVSYGALTAGKIGLQIDCLSDNATRTHHSIREILKNHGAVFASTNYLFQRRGVIRLSIKDDQGNFEDLWEQVVDAGAEEVEQEDDGFIEIITAPERLVPLTNLLSTNTAYTLVDSELAFIPSDPTDIPEPPDGSESSEMINLKAVVEALEDNPDCVRVWTSVG